MCFWGVKGSSPYQPRLLDEGPGLWLEPAGCSQTLGDAWESGTGLGAALAGHVCTPSPWGPLAMTSLLFSRPRKAGELDIPLLWERDEELDGSMEDGWCRRAQEWLGRHGDCAGGGRNEPGMLGWVGDKTSTRVPGLVCFR